jgi:hypothetical protein
MKGIIYIDSHGYRGYNNNFIEYISDKTKVIGGNYSLIDFNIKHNLLYYKNDIVNIEDYSHVYFCFRCDMMNEPINNEEKQEHLSGFNLEKFLMLENFFIENTTLLIINKINNAYMDFDRIIFFNKLIEHNIIVPKFQIVKDSNNRENNFDIKNIKSDIKYPMLLRTNSDFGGYNIYFIKNKDEFSTSYTNLLTYDHASNIEGKDNRDKTILITEYFDSYIDELKCKLSARVVLVKNKICCYLVEAYSNDKWIYKINDININYVKNNKIKTNELEHFKLALKYTNFNSLSELQTNCYKYVINYVDKYKHIFNNLHHIIGLDTISIDFLPLKDGPVILECGIKNGLSDYKVDLISKNIDLNEIKFLNNYLDDNFRNKIIYDALFSRKTIYCDIDNTVCNNIKRLRKYKEEEHINFNKMTSNDMQTDTVIDESVKYNNLLFELYDIKFITARNRIPNAYNETIKWLDNNNFKYSELILVNKLVDKFYYLQNKEFVTIIDDFTINHEYDKPELASETISMFKKNKVNFDLFKNNWKELYNKYKN